MVHDGWSRRRGLESETEAGMDVADAPSRRTRFTSEGASPAVGSGSPFADRAVRTASEHAFGDGSRSDRSAADESLDGWHSALPAPGERDVKRRTRKRADAISDLLVAAEHREPGAVDDLLTAVEREPAHDVKAVAVARMSRMSKGFAAPHQQRYAALVEEVFPSEPQVPASGPVEVRHYIGDEFYSDELAGYRKAGFEVNPTSASRAIIKKGRVHIIAHKGDQDVLRDMSDPRVHVVVYSGHSDLGGVIEGALRSSPPQKGSKLIIALQCIGVQTMPMLLAQYGDAQLLTTKDSSYDDEDMNILTSVLDGIDKGETFPEIRKAAAAKDKITNYLFPDQPESALHWDRDRDGRADVGGGRFADPTISVGDERHAQAQRILSAVGYINSSQYHYASDTPDAAFSQRKVTDRFVSAGIGEVPDGQMTKITRYKQRGRDKFGVVLNEELASEPKAFVAATSVYEMHLNTMDSVNGKLRPRDQIRALLFACDYLLRLIDSLDQANAAMAKLTVMKGFPKLTYGEIEDILLTDEEVATSAQIDKLGKLLKSRGWDPSAKSAG